MVTTFSRALKFATQDFLRNFGRSISAIFVLTVIIGLVTGLFFLQGVSNFVVSEIKNKIDITAYFIQDTQEEDMLSAKNQILTLVPEIKNIEYISREVALENFTQKHQDNPVFSNALTQVGGNPFLPSLNINTSGDASEYERVADVLQSDQFSPMIDRVDYSQKKDTIDKVFSITSAITNAGIGLAVLLILVAILVVFNTIKLAIENSKDEIATMSIVGASRWFVRLPFIIQGALFGLVACFICFVLTVCLAFFIPSSLAIVLSGFSLWNYFTSHFFTIVLLQLFFGAGLGIAASVMVVNKYLKV